MKIWLSIHLRNPGPGDWQSGLYMYVRPPIHVSQGDALHFKHFRVLELNRMATRSFREKINNNNKAESFFFVVFVEILMSTLTRIERNS